MVRLESGNLTFTFQPADLRQIISAVHAEFELALADKELRLQVELPEEPCIVDVDSSKIKVLLRQVYSNAVRVAPEGSRVEFTMTLGAGVYRLSVRDFGTGVPEAELDGIFNKFVQASNDAREEAAGLGLALCREIARIHRGRIWAENHPEAGAVFWIELPLLVREEEESAEPSEEEEFEEIHVNGHEVDSASEENERELSSS